MIRLRQDWSDSCNLYGLTFSAFELSSGLFRNSTADWRKINLRSLADNASEMKSTLIERSVLPERFTVPAPNSFEWIISRLTREYGGNVADRGIGALTASSVRDESDLPRNAADLTDVANFPFRKRWRINGLSRISKHPRLPRRIFHPHAPWGAGSRHLRDCGLEGRNERKKWTVLDNRDNDAQLNGKDRSPDPSLGSPFLLTV
jgi:hypothetical protein